MPMKTVFDLLRTCPKGHEHGARLAARAAVGRQWSEAAERLKNLSAASTGAWSDDAAEVAQHYEFVAAQALHGRVPVSSVGETG